MPRYACEIEFAGAGFAGTALQPGQRTLQGELRRVLALIDGPDPLTRTSGRLDAGVGAEALVVSCVLSRRWEPGALGRALNGNLGVDCRVLRVAAVADDWDALAAAGAKTYAYRVLERAAAPARDRAVWHRRHLTHPERLARCARALVGTHDLSAFAALRGDASDASDPVRRYLSATWTATPVAGDGTLWTFRITGLGFLYKQVRGLVGAQIAVAAGRHDEADFIRAIGAGRAHPRIGQIAPASGLCLERVAYRPAPRWCTL